MKITQEVRDFAAKQNARVESFVAAVPLRNGEGEPSAARDARGPQDGEEAQAQLDPLDAEAGMAEMSRVYNEGGRELYIGAGDRERD